MRRSKLTMFVPMLSAILGYTAASFPAESKSQPQTPPEIRSPLPTDGSLKTDRNTYTASCQGKGYDKRCKFTVVMTYTNSADATIYLSLCNPDDTYPIYGVLGLTNEGSAYDRVWACAGHDRAIKVLAGENRVDTLEISGPNVWDGKTGKPFGSVLEGRLQVRYTAYTCAEESASCSLPDELATSNVFEVRLP